MPDSCLIITPITELPESIRALERESLKEGYDFVKRLIADWNSGKNRFDKENEKLWEMRDDNLLVGVGGINIDPYLDDPTVGRVRHLYVTAPYRRIGAGRRLMAEIFSHCRGRFKKLTLRTNTSRGAKFYESLGFVKIKNSESSTHCFRL